MSAFAWTDAAVRTALGLRADLADDERALRRRVAPTRAAIRDGDLYVALVGDRFDGHDFVADALARGGRGAVVSRVGPGETRRPPLPRGGHAAGAGRAGRATGAALSRRPWSGSRAPRGRPPPRT